MSHSYVSNLMHCVFSTKERRPFITPELQTRLYPYIGPDAYWRLYSDEIIRQIHLRVLNHIKEVSER